MPVPHVRFTVRRLMVAVAIVAVVIAAWRRREHFRGWANEYGRRAAVPCTVPPFEPEAIVAWEKWYDRLMRRSRYHSDLRLKYESASDHPWLPVAPDPPEPE